MIINSKNKTIRYFVNDKDQGIAFQNIDITKIYHLAVCFASTDSIKIVKFSSKTI